MTPISRGERRIKQTAPVPEVSVPGAEYYQRADGNDYADERSPTGANERRKASLLRRDLDHLIFETPHKSIAYAVISYLRHSEPVAWADESELAEAIAYSLRNEEWKYGTGFHGPLVDIIAAIAAFRDALADAMIHPKIPVEPPPLSSLSFPDLLELTCQLRGRASNLNCTETLHNAANEAYQETLRRYEAAALSAQPWGLEELAEAMYTEVRGGSPKWAKADEWTRAQFISMAHIALSRPLARAKEK